MKFIVTVALALLLLSFEAVLVKYLGLQVTRIDVTVAMVAFLALRASVIEGAFGSFVIGYLLDLMSGQPTGLYTFLAVLVFLLGRIANAFVDVRSAGAFFLFAAAIDALHGVLAAFFTWLTARDGTFGISAGGFFLQVFLTGLAGFALYPLFRKLDPGSERPEMGTLR